MNEQLNYRASTPRSIGGREGRLVDEKLNTNKSPLFFGFFFVGFYYCLIFLICSHLNQPSGRRRPARSPPPAQRWDSLRQSKFVCICLSCCLFLSLFVYARSCLWPSQVFLRLRQFSAWSPLICLFVYLLSQHSWFIYIYVSGMWQ